MNARLEQFFAQDGPLAAVFGESYGERGEQVRLAGGALDTILGGGVLLGDAPTGTGKSMAYLAPVALAKPRAKAVVSTATKALQHQIVEKDLPALVKACEKAGVRPPTFALLKGRGEFLCDRRMDEFIEEQGVFLPEGLREIDEWRRVSSRGDKERSLVATEENRRGINESLMRPKDEGEEE